MIRASLTAMALALFLAAPSFAAGPPGVCPAWSANGPNITHPAARAVVKAWARKHPGLLAQGWEDQVQPYHKSGTYFQIDYVNKATGASHIANVAPIFNRCSIGQSQNPMANGATGPSVHGGLYVPGVGEVTW